MWTNNFFFPSTNDFRFLLRVVSDKYLFCPCASLNGVYYQSTGCRHIKKKPLSRGHSSMNILFSFYSFNRNHINTDIKRQKKKDKKKKNTDIKRKIRLAKNTKRKSDSILFEESIFIRKRRYFFIDPFDKIFLNLIFKLFYHNIWDWSFIFISNPDSWSHR